MIGEDNLYTVNYPEFEQPFNYIIKHSDNEVRGHGEKAPQ